MCGLINRRQTHFLSSHTKKKTLSGQTLIAEVTRDIQHDELK